MSSGVYILGWKSLNRVFIGKSGLDVNKRLAQQLAILSEGCNHPSSCMYGLPSPSDYYVIECEDIVKEIKSQYDFYTKYGFKVLNKNLTKKSDTVKESNVSGYVTKVNKYSSPIGTLNFNPEGTLTGRYTQKEELEEFLSPESSDSAWENL